MSLSATPASEDPNYAKFNPGWATNYPPFDARYPHQNQRVNCLRNYIDFHRCKALKGDDYANCNYFKKVYMAKCHRNLTDKWDEQVENGTFLYKI